MYRKIWAIIRYEIYLDLEKNHGGITGAEKDHIYASYDRQMARFETFRNFAYKKIMKDDDAPHRTSRHNMLKAFITYSVDI